MILKIYIDEYCIEIVNYKIYIMWNYKKVLMNKLYIYNEIFFYLELEIFVKIVINFYYSYFVKLFFVLVKIGLYVFE